MKDRKINSLVWVGLLGTFIIGSSLFTDVYRAFRAEQNIWWTPQTMRLTPEETRDHIELYIGGKLLQKHLSDGTLFSVDKNGEQYRLVSKDVSARMNNWNKMKASLLANTTASGFLFGVSLTLLITGLIQVFQKKNASRSATR
jgi:hypothetical protein